VRVQGDAVNARGTHERYRFDYMNWFEATQSNNWERECLSITLRAVGVAHYLLRAGGDSTLGYLDSVERTIRGNYPYARITRKYFWLNSPFVRISNSLTILHTLLIQRLLVMICTRSNRAFSLCQKIGFNEPLDSIVANGSAYQRDAYVFLRDALDFTTKQQKKIKGRHGASCAGPELLEGVRQYALKEFGPMVIRYFLPGEFIAAKISGNMVFNLIEAGISERRRKIRWRIFKNVYDFKEAL